MIPAYTPHITVNGTTLLIIIDAVSRIRIISYDCREKYGRLEFLPLDVKSRRANNSS